MTLSARWLGSPNYAAANRQIGDVRAIIIHDVEGTLAGATAVFRQVGGPSAHFAIDTDGSLTQFVQEQAIAFSVAAFGATPSLNRNRPSWLPAYTGRYSAVNAATIGIELVGYASQGYTAAQYVTLGALCADLCQRWQIIPTYLPDAGVAATLTTHGFLQADRTDPGPRFDWAAFRAAFDAAYAPEDALTADQQQMLTLLAGRDLTTAQNIADLFIWGDQTAKDNDALRAEVASANAALSEAQHQAAAVHDLVGTLTGELQAAQTQAQAGRLLTGVTLHYSDGTSQAVAADTR